MMNDERSGDNDEVGTLNAECQTLKSVAAIHRSSLKQQRSTFTTLAFYKPYGVLSCFTDPAGRPTLAGYIPVPDVYPAGRLDYDTEGLLLLTSDGSLAHHITDPRHKLPKVYLVQVERVPDEKTLARLGRGMLLGGRRTRPAQVELLPLAPDLPQRPVPILFRSSGPTAWGKISLRQVQNLHVRRMTPCVGHA